MIEKFQLHLLWDCIASDSPPHPRTLLHHTHCNSTRSAALVHYTLTLHNALHATAIVLQHCATLHLQAWTGISVGLDVFSTSGTVSHADFVLDVLATRSVYGPYCHP